MKMTDTIVACAVGNRYAGYLLLADALKEDAKVAIDRLKALNIENIQILSGDKQSIVTNFAEKLGESLWRLAAGRESETPGKIASG